MTVRAMIDVIRFTAAALRDVQRWCLLSVAEEIDRAEQAKRNR